MSGSRSYRFGEFTLDLKRGALVKAGADVRLRPKSFEVLRLLAERHGELVTRDELLDAVWGKVVVTDGALTQCLIDVRRALGDESQQVVRTVPRRGYILDVPVQVSDEPDEPTGHPPPAPEPPPTESPQPGGRRPAVLGSIVLPTVVAALTAIVIGWGMAKRAEDPDAPPPSAPAAARPAIAVLPFVDMSEARDQGYLADGIAEEILHRLAQSGELRVIARSSSFAFRSQPADIAEIARRLEVSHVLEGSVRRSGNRVRVTAQLIAASSSSHVWSQSYDRELGDLIAVQDDIASAVARSLDATLARRATPHRDTAGAAAYESLLQGEFFYQRRAPGDFARAIEYLERAVALDPGFARAWASLAAAYSMRVEPGSPSAATWRQRQGAAARKAVELDPLLASAHKRLAQYYLETLDFRRAEEHSRRAFELDPNDPLVIGGRVSEAISRDALDEAIGLARRAVEADPLSPVSRTILGALLLGTVRLDEAMTEYQQVLDLNPSAGPEVGIEIVRIQVLQRRLDEARAGIAQLPEGQLRDYGLALLHASAGQEAEADAALARLAAGSAGIVDSIRLAEAYALRGRTDDAFSTLARQRSAIEADAASAPGWMAYFRNELRVSPFLAPLRRDARWTALFADA